MLSKENEQSLGPLVKKSSELHKPSTLVSTVSFFVTLGLALESFLLVLLIGNAKIVSKALEPPFVTER